MNTASPPADSAGGSSWFSSAIVAVVAFLAGTKIGSKQIAPSVPSRESSLRSHPHVATGLVPAVFDSPSEDPVRVSQSRAAAFLQGLAGTPGHLQWLARCSTWLGAASEQDVVAVLLQLGDIKDTKRRELLEGLAFERWGELDGPLALAYLESVDRHGLKQKEIVARMFAGWVQQDAPGAIEGLIASGHALRLGDDPPVRDLLHKTIQVLCDSNVTLATELSVSFAGRLDRHLNALSALAGIAEWHYERGGAAAVLDWFHQLPTEARLCDSLELAARSALERNDLDGSGVLIHEIGLDKVGGFTLMDYTHKLVQRDPQAAALWVLSLPAGEIQSHAFSGLMIGTVGRSDDFPWLAHFPAGANTDALIVQEALGMSQFLPSRSFFLAAKISDPAERKRVMTQAALHWLAHFPDDARTYLSPEFVSWWSRKQPVYSEAEIPLPR